MVWHPHLLRIFQFVVIHIVKGFGIVNKAEIDVFLELFCFPGGSDGKVSACNVGDLGSIPGLGRFPGEGNGTPLQYPCLGNSMDVEAWWATIYGATKSLT